MSRYISLGIYFYVVETQNVELTGFALFASAELALLCDFKLLSAQYLSKNYK